MLAPLLPRVPRIVWLMSCLLAVLAVTYLKLINNEYRVEDQSVG